jgi:hypothetical protein
VTIDLTAREIRLLLEAAALYDAQTRPPGVTHLRSAGRKLLASLHAGPRPKPVAR